MSLLSIRASMEESDRQFMERLYHDFHRLMFKQARRYFQDQVDIEDVVQQSFVKLIKYLPTIKKLKRNTLAVYIVNVIRSCSMDIYRKSEIERETSFIDIFEGFEETVVDDFDLDSLMDISFSLDQLADALLQLPEGLQFVLEAKYLQCWSDAEIAAVLGIKKETVRTRLFRAKKKALLILLRGKNEA
ncbi:MAG: RNA polymerase sigma factor [Anaerolineaceae bacterium]